MYPRFVVDAEMKSFAKEERSESPSPDSDIIDEKSGEQPNGGIQGEIDSSDSSHRISPTSSSGSMSSEADSTTANRSSTMVCTLNNHY